MRRLSALPADEHGIALVMVIWVLALLSLMATSFLAEARVELRRSGNLRDRAEAEALAEAGIHIAIARLVAERGDIHTQRWTEVVAGGSVTLALVEERGKIDLNEAEPALLSSLFMGQDLPELAASALTAAIVDFRDPDRAPGLDGAEDAAYPAGSGGAKDARFETTDELLQVKGMTPALYARIAPLVTVHSAVPVIDPLLAEPGVLAAVPNIDRAELTHFLAQRAKLTPVLNASASSDGTEAPSLSQKRATALAQLQAAVPQRNSVTRFFLDESFFDRTFTILAEAITAKGARFRREAVLRLTEESPDPFQLLEWRRPQPLD